MKKLFILSLALISVFFSLAQTNIPQLVSFSAVVRDANNQLLANTPVSIRLSFKQGGANGPLVYCALHQDSTNANGFISIQLNREVLGTGCNGAPSTAFENIPWQNGGFWMEVEYQTIASSPFVNLGQLELASSFYAFAAGTAERITNFDLNGIQNGDVMVYNSTTQMFEPGQSGITSVQWANVQNKPNFATVATSGSYADLLNTPITINSISSNGDTLYLSNGQTFISSNNGVFSLLPPTATVQVASNIQITNATLNGTVNANSLSSTVLFEWGATNAYGNVANVSQSPITGLLNTSISANLTGLTGNTTYHFRIKATNAVNTEYSNDMIFTTIAPVIPTLTTASASDVKGNSAKAGGSITNDGGSPITTQGLCWSTSSDPTTSNSTTTSFTDAMTGLSPNTVYYVRAYAINVSGTSYGNQISFNSGRVIGSIHAGGLVFYNDGNGNGLVCAETDQSTGAEWGCFGDSIGGTSTGINAGAANTIAIVAGCTTVGIAAKLCYDLVFNTYSDWFLPSKDELDLMYLNLKTQNLGVFANSYYLSSSEYDASRSWVQIFNDGSQNHYYKSTSSFYVRAVRAF